MSSHRSKPAHYEETILGIKLDEISSGNYRTGSAQHSNTFGVQKRKTVQKTSSKR